MVVMDNWRTQQRGESYRQQGDFQRTGSSLNKRSQMAPGSWNSSVPPWEKKFCATIGSIPWHKFLEMKKYAHLYDNIAQWKDSGSEEAFNNAKNRFWAQINGLPCDISLPGPDIYIDEIDWNSQVDPELILDLEREPEVPDHEEEVSINCSSLLLNQPVPCTGWGDEEEYQDKGMNECDKNALYTDNTWENSCPQSNQNANDLWWGSNKWENNVSASQNYYGGKTWNSNQKNGEGGGWQMSRYKTSRIHGDNYPMYQSQRWRNNGKWREPLNSVREDKKPMSRQWKMISS